MDKAHAHLTAYLNDHLAGAAVAVEALDALERATDADVRRFAAALRVDILEDRQVLEALMRRADAAPSALRQAAGWMSGKIAELKVRLDDPTDGALRIFELLELLAVGIDGKRALWAALEAASETMPPLRGSDYQKLRERAEEQRRSLEVVRLQWALAAFSATSDSATL